MKTFIGTKIVQAEPQTELQAGKDCTIDENGESRPGYKVVYEDGYVSWSPKEVFERCYREITVQETAMCLGGTGVA